jgi:hypothetical protein
MVITVTAVSDVLDPARKTPVILARKAVVTFRVTSRVRDQPCCRGANDHRHGGVRRLRSGPGGQQRAAGGFHPEQPGRVLLAGDAAVQFPRDPGEPGHEGRGRRAVDGLGHVALDEPAGLEHADPVSQGEGFSLVVGDVEDGGVILPGQRGDLGAQPLPQVRVEVGERFVAEQHRGPGDQGPGQRHPLLLPAGQFRRPAVRQPGQPHPVQHRQRPPPGFLPGQAEPFQRIDHVRQRTDLRPQRVVLEHHRQASPLGLDVPLLIGDDLAADRDAARRHPVDPGHQPQESGLTRTGRAEKDHELPGGHRQVNAVERGYAAEHPGQAGELQRAGWRGGRWRCTAGR